MTQRVAAEAAVEGKFKSSLSSLLADTFAREREDLAHRRAEFERIVADTPHPQGVTTLKEDLAALRAENAEAELRDLRVRHIALKDAVRGGKAFALDTAKEAAVAQAFGGGMGLVVGAFIGSLAGGLAGTAAGMAGGLRSEDLDAAAGLGSGLGAFIGSIMGLGGGVNAGEVVLAERMVNSCMYRVAIDSCSDGRTVHEEVLANLAAKGIKL